MKKIIIDNINLLKEAVELTNNEVMYNTFLWEVKAFLSNLLKEPISTTVSSFFSANNISKPTLLRLLLNNKIIEREESVSDEDITNPKFKIKYKVPKKNFDRKVKKLYIKLFEKNLPEKEIPIEEDGGMGGATSAAACNAVAPIGPITSQPIKRKTIYITNEQLKQLEEATATFTAGNYQYDVPFMFKRKDGKKDEAYIHNKPGGIGCERVK